MKPHLALLLSLTAGDPPTPPADERVWLSATFDGDLGGADPEDVEMGFAGRPGSSWNRAWRT